MEPKHLKTHVTWFKGAYTLLNGNPGILKLDGDEVSFTSTSGGESFRMSASEIKEFNVVGTTQSNYSRFSIRGMLFGIKGAQWYIIPHQQINTKLSFIKSVNSHGDNNYKDWQSALGALGVSTYSDKKSSLLIISICFISVIILIVLWNLA